MTLFKILKRSVKSILISAADLDPSSPLQLGKIGEKIYKVFKFLSTTP